MTQSSSLMRFKISIITSMALFNIAIFQSIQSHLYKNIMNDNILILLMLIILTAALIVVKMNKIKELIGVFLIGTLLFWLVLFFVKPQLTYENAESKVKMEYADLILVDQNSTNDKHISEIGFSTQPSENKYNIFLEKDYVFFGYFKKEDQLSWYIVNPITGSIKKVTPSL